MCVKTLSPVPEITREDLNCLANRYVAYTINGNRHLYYRSEQIELNDNIIFETGLTVPSPSEAFKEGVFLTAGKDSVKYIYNIDGPLDSGAYFTDTSQSNYILTDILGDLVLIVGATSNSISVDNAENHFMSEGDSVEVEGKTVTLLYVGSDDTVVMDVDGVLTDGGMYYSEGREELKKFNTRDGKGIELLRNAGFKTAIITSENTKIVERRAKKLCIDYVYQGITDKAKTLAELSDKSGIAFEEMLYVGDDVNDLSAIK